MAKMPTGLIIRRENMKLYKYGMRLRGFSIGCQPMDGFYERQDDRSGWYHDILLYTRKLTDEEVEQYELDYIGSVEQ